jgi:hypothetical protein
MLLDGVFEEVDKGIAAVEINATAGLGGSRQVIVGIEPRIGLAAFGCSVQ